MSLLQGIALVAVTWAVLYITGETVISNQDSKQIQFFYDDVANYLKQSKNILDQMLRETRQAATASYLDNKWSKLGCGWNYTCYQSYPNGTTFAKQLELEVNNTLTNYYFYQQMMSKIIIQRSDPDDLPQLSLKYGNPRGDYCCLEEGRAYTIRNNSYPYIATDAFDLNTQQYLGFMMVNSKTFKPSTSSWYTAATKAGAGKKAWATISYQGSATKQFSLQASTLVTWMDKVYGAVCAQFGLNVLRKKLQKIQNKFSKESYLDIYELDGNIVSSTLNPIEQWSDSAQTFIRVNINDGLVDDEVPTIAARAYFKDLANGGPQETTKLISTWFRDGKIASFYNIFTMKYTDDMGLNWILALTMKREFFFEYVLSSSVLIFVLFVVLVFVSSGAIFFCTCLIVLPIQGSAKKLSNISKLKLSKKVQKRFTKSKEKSLKRLTTIASQTKVTDANSAEVASVAKSSITRGVSSRNSDSSWAVSSEGLPTKAFRVGCVKPVESIKSFFTRLGFFYEIWSLNTSISKMEEAMQFFVKFIPVEVVKTILDKKSKNMLEQRNISVFFSDIKDFTTFTESVSSAELLVHLTNYFEVCTNSIENVGGVIDKFIGDASMALYNCIDTKIDEGKIRKLIPKAWKKYLGSKDFVFDEDDFILARKLNSHSTLAVFSAIMIQKDFKSMRKQRKTPFLVRIGIASGNCLVGNIGSNTRLNFTALGDTVNVAARLEPLNKLFDTNIMISGKTLEAQPEMRDFFKLIWIDSVCLKGKDQESSVYAVMGLKKRSALDYPIDNNVEALIEQDNGYPFLELPRPDEESPVISEGRNPLTESDKARAYNSQRKLKKTQVLEVCSNIMKHLFDDDKFSLMLKFVEDIEPFLISKFPRIIQHWKQRAGELVELVKMDPEMIAIPNTKHLHLNSK